MTLRNRIALIFKKTGIQGCLLVAGALFLVFSPWIFSIILVGLAGMILVAAATLKWGLKGGIIFSLWASGSVFVSLGITGGNLSNVLVSISLYFILAGLLGYSIDTIRKQQRQMLASQKYYEGLLHSTFTPLFVVNHSLLVVYFNRQMGNWLNSLGVSHPVPGSPVDKSFPFLDKHELIYYRQVFETGKPVNSEEILVIGGLKRYMEFTRSPVFDEENKTDYVITAIRDITEARQAREELENKTEEYEKVFNSTQSAMFLVEVNDDNHFQYIRNNLAHQEATGITPEKIRGKTPCELLGEETGARVADRYRRCVQTAAPFSYEETLPLPEGEKNWYTTLTPVFNQDQKVTNIVGSAQDITERKKSDKILSQLLRDQEILLHNIDIQIWYLIDAETYGTVNQARADFLGLERKELQHRKLFEVSKTREKVDECISGNREAFATKRQARSEEWAVSGKGEHRLLYITKTPKLDERENVEYAVCAAQDITEYHNILTALRNNEQKFRSMVETAKTVALVITDLDSIIQEFSPGAEEIFGYRKKEILGRHVSPLHCPEEVELFSSYVNHLHRNKAGFTTETKLVRKSGETFPALFTLQPLLDAEGNVSGTLGITVDISQLKETEKELRLSEEKFRSYIDNAPYGVFVTDENGNYLELNPMACYITGYTQEELVGINFFDRLPLSAQQKGRNHFKTLLKHGKAYVENPYINKNGSIIDISISAVKLPDNKLLCFVQDITDRKQAEEKIRYMSFHDTATGLYNRRYLENELQRLDVERQLPLSLVMADLNGLKLVNDTFGHRSGDELLKQAAAVLKESCRQEDIVARWGGDEFVVFLPQTGFEEAEEIIKRIKVKCGCELVNNIPLSISLGAASKTTPEKEVTEILKEAEDHMYEQKLTESRIARSKILEAMLKTLGEISYETGEHIHRMQNIATRIGKKINLSETELNRLNLLVNMHDIGKITISESILKKENRLTDKEWIIIKKHPETGYRIARSAEEISHVAEDILSHHENWDGTGYPQGLKGKNIPLLARIVAIVDTYEVITSGRPYNKEVSSKKAGHIIKTGSGHRFDPELVKIFLSKERGTDPLSHL